MRLPLESLNFEIHFLVVVVSLIVIYLAWCSTKVREYHRGNEGHINFGTAGAHHISFIRRSFSQQSSQPSSTPDVGEVPTENDLINNITDSIITETIEELNLRTGNAIPEDPTNNVPLDTGPDEIIREMDRDIPDHSELRQRRNIQEVPSTSTASSDIPATSSRDSLNAPESPVEENIQIKLKFLNEDVKIVSGSPLEHIGAFKKRNFSVELRDEKLVKLVFNGQVLLDNQSIKSCGLFNDCVVHCLIHQNRRTAVNLVVPGETPAVPSHTGILPENGSLFIYIGIAAVLVTLVICWFCRIQYAILFSWYSTVGLILMTLLFLVMLPLIVLITTENT